MATAYCTSKLVFVVESEKTRVNEGMAKIGRAAGVVIRHDPLLDAKSCRTVTYICVPGERWAYRLRLDTSDSEAVDFAREGGEVESRAMDDKNKCTTSKICPSGGTSHDQSRAVGETRHEYCVCSEFSTPVNGGYVLHSFPAKKKENTHEHTLA